MPTLIGVASRNTTKGETFVMEVTPEMFEMLEAICEPPVSDELEGAVLSASDDETAVALGAEQPEAVH
jgi:hypothetical protein